MDGDGFQEEQGPNMGTALILFQRGGMGVAAGIDVEHLIRRLVLGIAVVSMASGALVLIGWLFDVAFLKSILPAFATMKVNTAIGFLLSGASMSLISIATQKPGNSSTLRRVERVCAAAVVIMSLATLLEYGLDLQFGIDNLFLPDTASPDARFPGRMSQGTAFNFILLGSALFFLPSVEKTGVIEAVQAAALLLLLLSLVALVSYVYNPGALYSIVFYDTMALHTCFLFILLGLGLLLVDPRSGIMRVVSSRYLGGRVARPLLVAAVLPPFLAGWFLSDSVSAGVVDPGLGISIFTITSILVAAIIVWTSARWLNQVDAAKETAMDRLQSLVAELGEKEERFRQLAENINEVFFLSEPGAPQMMYASPAFHTVWGTEKDRQSTDPHSWMNGVHPEDQDLARDALAQSSKTGDFDFTCRILRPDKEERWVRVRGFPIHDPGGSLYRVAGLAEDITHLVQSRDKIQRLNRVYAVLSGINMVIVRARDRQLLFNEACRIAVDVGKLRMAWIGLVLPGSSEIIPQASAGYIQGYLEQGDLPFVSENPDELTATAQAVRTGKPVIRNDIAGNDRKTPWKEAALARGYRAVASFPLLVSGELSGVMSLYAEEVDYFNGQERRLLEEMATDIAFAMEFIDQEKRLDFLAYHEPVTGLANRSAMYARLSDTASGKPAKSSPFALILANINDFRNINDTLGHQAGDELMRLVAKRLNSTVWEIDVVASLGGDDFAIMLPRLASKEHINLVVNKILNSMQHGFTISGIPVNVEMTFGAAVYPDHGDNADLLWQHADVALRKAKESERNYLLYDPVYDHFHPEQLLLLGELPRAIDGNELVLHYQPKIDLRKERVVAVEALVRWQHPARGLIYPDIFINPAENTGLINPLTTWVLANALRQVHAWRGAGYRLNLSVNISARNLQNPELKNEVIGLVRSSRFPLEGLEIEITESAIMVDPLHARQVLSGLNHAGISLSVDDFGIGQTSLTYLKELPVKQMKIDKSFVMNLDSAGNHAIVHSAVELGHNLGLKVTAEGIEDEASLRALQELDCDFGQGYYFSKPLPPDQIISWLRESPYGFGPAAAST